jgi:hypothetical protein
LSWFLAHKETGLSLAFIIAHLKKNDNSILLLCQRALPIFFFNPTPDSAPRLWQGNEFLGDAKAWLQQPNSVENPDWRL